MTDFAITRGPQALRRAGDDAQIVFLRGTVAATGGRQLPLHGRMIAVVGPGRLVTIALDRPADGPEQLAPLYDSLVRSLTAVN